MRSIKIKLRFVYLFFMLVEVFIYMQWWRRRIWRRRFFRELGQVQRLARHQHVSQCLLYCARFLWDLPSQLRARALSVVTAESVTLNRGILDKRANGWERALKCNASRSILDLNGFIDSYICRTEGWYFKQKFQIYRRNWYQISGFY